MEFRSTRLALASQDDLIIAANELSPDESSRGKPMCRFHLAMFLVAALWSLPPSTRGDEAGFFPDGQPVSFQDKAERRVIGAAPGQGTEQQIRDLEGQI